MPTERSPLRLLRKLAVVLLLSFLLLEGLVRGVLFEGWLGGVEALDILRQPSSYTQVWEDEHWQLRHVLGRAPHIDRERVDRELGWVPTGVQPGEYDHVDRARVEGRRPVLLFGDSYAAGMAPKRALFQSLLNRSDAADELRMLNYGCPGYGLDQAWMMMERALELWAEQDPIVLMGILVDDDFDRARLEIRSLPKPRFAPEGRTLVLERQEVPELDDYMDGAFPWWKLWSWRLLVHGGTLPETVSARLRGDAAREDDCRRVAELLIETIVAELEARELAFGFVLFHSQHALTHPESLGWREMHAVEILERLDVPHVLTRESLAADLAASGNPPERYFYSSGMQMNHPNRLGNQVIFSGLLPLIERLHRGRPWRAP